MPTALLSVYDKTGIVEFARELIKLGWGIFASGGTAKIIREAGLPVSDVAELVGGGPILGHRVVTLSREVHAGLLARKPEDEEEMTRLGLGYIDLVYVNLYPLEGAIDNPNATLASVIEMTDIGGPAILRSAAKGNRIVMCDQRDQLRVLEWLQAGQPHRDQFIHRLAAKAEFVVTQYTLMSANFRSDGLYDGILGEKVLDCCYGENRYQVPAALYRTDSHSPLATHRFAVAQGTAPSYVNLRDVSRLSQTMLQISLGIEENYNLTPHIAIGCKHGNPCGAAIGEIKDLPPDGDIISTLRRMVAGDPLAIFGGIVMTNFGIGLNEAEVLLQAGDGKRILDGVAAPGFTAEAKEVLERKNNRCRLYENHYLEQGYWPEPWRGALRMPVIGGYLKQPNYSYVLDFSDQHLERNGGLDHPTKADMLLAWAVGSTSNSNTVTLAKDRMIIGNGVGQQDRVGCCKLAIERARRAGHDTNGAVAYSDSFFPFTDGPEILAEAGIKAIFASSGSVKDKEVKEFCASQGITLCLIPDAEGRGFFGH